MKKNKIRDTPEIVIPKGYGIDDLLDFDDEGYENGEPVLVEEVKAIDKGRKKNGKIQTFNVNGKDRNIFSVKGE